MSASVLEIATVEAHGALRANEVVKSSALVGITARVIGSWSCRPWLPPSGAGVETGSNHLAQLAESSLSTGTNGRSMPEIVGAVKQAA
jgi:hypothetical protein